MNDYQWMDKEQTRVKKHPNIYLSGTGSSWKEFQEYLAAGGQVDPWKTDEELFEISLEEKIIELKAERDSMVNTIVGTPDTDKKLKQVSRAVKLLKKKYESRATQAEIEELDNQEVVDDLVEDMDSAMEASFSWLEDQSRTVEEIQGYDVVTTPGWPITP